jgi:AraC-like DNA-binding protein
MDATIAPAPEAAPGNDELASAVRLDRTDEDNAVALTASMIKGMLGLADTVAPTTEFMLGRLTELLRAEVMRGRPDNSSPRGARQSAALDDRIVSRALRLVHSDPARRWTVSDLAREAGTSRTVLTDRFNAVMGQSPIEYVTNWRMQLAAERIRNHQSTFAAIAADVGYESEAAFNRAFKRVIGVTPGRWRAGVTAQH